MKKIEKIEQLREILREIIISQKQDEIKNFNSLYDYSNITDMSDLWDFILNNKDIVNLLYAINWKKIKFPILDMKNVKKCEHIFYSSLLYEINLINTQNVKSFLGAFSKTKNLKKISLDLSSCKERKYLLQYSGIEEAELLNTQNIIEFTFGLRETKKLKKVNDLYLDNCERIDSFLENSNIEKINLFNTQNIKRFQHLF